MVGRDAGGPGAPGRRGAPPPRVRAPRHGGDAQLPVHRAAHARREHPAAVPAALRPVATCSSPTCSDVSRTPGATGSRSSSRSCGTSAAARRAARTIDIGRADPKQRGYRVDTGLLYHELTHCVDDTMPIFAGLARGSRQRGRGVQLRGARPEGRRARTRSNATSGRSSRTTSGRDLEYWRIPSYGPSAGFFLHFLETYAKTPTGHDWKPYRRLFRDVPIRAGARRTRAVRRAGLRLVPRPGVRRPGLRRPDALPPPA